MQILRHFFTTDNTYTTRSWVTGTGENKGFKVVTKAVNGVKTGQELWFSNTGCRNTTGVTGNTGNSIVGLPFIVDTVGPPTPPALMLTIYTMARLTLLAIYNLTISCVASPSVVFVNRVI